MNPCPAYVCFMARRAWDGRAAKVRTEVYQKLVAGMMHTLRRPGSEEDRAAWRHRLTPPQQRLVKEIESMEQGEEPICKQQKQFPKVLQETLTKDAEIAKVLFIYVPQLQSSPCNCSPQLSATLYRRRLCSSPRS